MTPATAPDALLIAALIVPTVVALLHLATFPYVRSTAIPGWFLAIAVLPIVGPTAWFVHSRSRVAQARVLLEELTAAS